MRCVERGPAPHDEAGLPVDFAQYQDAAPYLKQRLGRYCSFCERVVRVSLAVEHKLPKRHHPDLERSWDNFLLACGNCNSMKGTQVAGVTEVLWPDSDDTFGALEYLESGRIQPRHAPAVNTEACAAATLRLVGLDRELFSSNTDHRWIDRLEVWSQAVASREQVMANDTPALRRLVTDSAAAIGGFSIWMEVFRDDPAMRQALCKRFPGTALRSPDVPPNID